MTDEAGKSELRHTVTVEIRQLTSAEDLAAWGTYARAQGNLWQSPEWKGYQEALGRETRVYGAFDCHGERSRTMTAAALVIIDRTTGGLSTWDIPRGPIGPDATTLMKTIADDARASGAITLRLSPSVTLPVDGFTPSGGHTHPEATRIIDLTKTHDEILAQMHQKGRYNIKIAQRDGVTIRPGTAEDIDAFYGLLRSTSARDVFGISPKNHYARFLTNLEGSFFLIAEHQKTPVAGFLGVCWNGTGYYYYGASDHAKRALMAPYLLQWEAMKLCRERGCVRYDLLGIAPPGSGPEHEWAGISSFKEKFGGSIIEYPQEQQVMIRPLMWRLLQLKRKFF